MHDTRESYLQALAFALEQYIEECQIYATPFVDGWVEVPTYLVSVGLPSKRPLSEAQRCLGQCFTPEWSPDHQTHHIFVSPTVSEPLVVAAVLLHELLHAYVGTQHKHRGPFKKAHKKVGFEGKPTLSYPSPELAERLHAIVQSVGDYPHQQLVPVPKEKKSSNRQRKVACLACGYVLRTTKKWLEQAGPPICPCSGEGPKMEVVEVDE